MKLYADTANIKEISDLYQLGVISGVTTNPSLVAKEPKGDFNSLIINIAEYCFQNSLSLSVEVFEIELHKMAKEARELSTLLKKFRDVIKIKVPISTDGLKVINQLAKDGINTNATACFSEQQLCLAAEAGASYVSLFYCRLKQHGGDCKKVLSRTRNFIEANNLDTKIIAGSIRTQTDVSDAWEEGAHIVTTSASVINEMVVHPKTEDSIKQFIEDFSNWRS